MSDQETFAGGPPRWLLTGWKRPEHALRHTALRALAVIAIGWLPLLLLTLIFPPHELHRDLSAFRQEMGLHFRYLFAAPLFVMARLICGARLGGIARQMGYSGLLGEQDRGRLADRIEKARALVHSKWADVGTLFLAFALVLIILLGSRGIAFASWLAGGDGQLLSPAGWWNVLVSSPLLLSLILGWFWRTIVWTRLLFQISRMDLRLIAVHPDRAAGIGFLTQSVRAYSIVAMAFGAIAAGRFAKLYVGDHALNLPDPLLIGGTLIIALVLAVGPLLVFTPRLTHVWRKGMMDYGALGLNLGIEFERKWLNHPDVASMLDQPDFSASADLYGTISNAYTIRFLPIDGISIVMLLAASIVPFIVAMVLTMPFELVIRTLRGLLV